MRPLFINSEEYRDFRGLFLSRRNKDDKINFYPGVGKEEDEGKHATNCSKLERIAEKGFSKEEINVFRKKGVVEKIRFLKDIYEVYVVKNFIRLPDQHVH